MTEHPYAPPAARLDTDADAPIPADVLKSIRSAWIAGAVSGTVTLAVTLIAMSGSDVDGMGAWNLLDVALIFGLTFGIYRRSRACAALMLLYFVASKIIIWIEVGKPTGIFLAAVFAYFFVKGLFATITYHRLLRAHRGN